MGSALLLTLWFSQPTDTAAAAYTFTVSDGASNAWATVAGPTFLTDDKTSLGGPGYLVTFATFNARPVTLIRASWSPAATARSNPVTEYYFVEFSGVSSLDGSSVTVDATVGSGPIALQPATVLCPNSAIHVHVECFGTCFANSTWTEISSFNNNIDAYLVASPGPFAANGLAHSNSGFWIGHILVLRPSSCPVTVVTASIAAGTTVSIVGDASLTAPFVNGTLLVSGSLTLANVQVASTAIVRVNGTISVLGPLSVQSGASLTTGSAFVISSGGSIIPILQMPITVTTTFIVAQFGSFSGNASSVGRAVPAAQQQACLGPATGMVTASALSVTVPVVPCGGGLSTGAIVGIAVGCSVAGILLAVAVFVCLRRQQAKMAVQVREQVMEDLRAQPM
jgi:hypothetical protein